MTDWLQEEEKLQIQNNVKQSFSVTFASTETNEVNLKFKILLTTKTTIKYEKENDAVISSLEDTCNGDTKYHDISYLM